MNFSKIISGVMTWAEWGKNLSQNEMVALMQHCLEVGITTFDHADIYGGYTTEAAFGKAFAQSGISRNDIQLISKCGIQYLCENRNNQIKHYNYSKDYVVWSAEQSLKNLKTDYLDLFLLHRPSPLMHPHEIAEAVTTLKSEGKIKHFGVSNFTPSQVELIEKNINVEVNQIEFSLTQHSAMYDGTLDQMMTKNMNPMSWSPLGSVFKTKDDQTERISKVLEELCEKYKATKDQLLLAWILKHPSKVHPVIGTTNPERLKLAVDATNIELDLEDWFMLLAASQGHKVP